MRTKNTIIKFGIYILAQVCKTEIINYQERISSQRLLRQVLKLKIKNNNWRNPERFRYGWFKRLRKIWCYRV